MISWFLHIKGLMQFANVAYMVFLAVAVCIYYVLPGVRSRCAWLLGLSVLFYLFVAPRSLWLLLGVTTVTYFVGLALGRVERPGARRLLLTLGIVAVISALGFFKYSAALGYAASALAHALGQPTWFALTRLALPLGMSFWTFQTVGYLIDVYRNDTKPERNPFLYALAVMYFPVVTAGPITPVQDLVLQLREKHPFRPDSARSGLLLMGRGLFKKLMVADRLGVLVAAVFTDPRAIGPRHGPLLMLAALSFSVQLYCDFSGYTDIVRGSARLFGVELPVNFRVPYLATSVRDFWRRWHISLMDWLRRNVYIPLGGSRKGTGRRYANVLAVFLVSGLWHGTGLTFLVWGALNGAFVILGDLTAPVRRRVLSGIGVLEGSAGQRALQVATTFVLMTMAWVFFRASSLSDAWYVVTRMWVFDPAFLRDGSVLKLGLGAADLIVGLASVAVVAGGDVMSTRVDISALLDRQTTAVRWLLYYLLVLVILVFGYYGLVYRAADFIYFRF